MHAAELIESLGLERHFEGGWFREIYRSAAEVSAPQGRRMALTSIYYLLEAGQRSRWHVVTSDEVWHFYAGGALELLAYDPACERLTQHVLAAPDATLNGVAADAAGPCPVAVIPAGVWQAARPLDGYALVGCTVAPGFELKDFRFVVDLPDHRRHFHGELAGYAGLL